MDRLPPSSPEAEKGVLGCILLSPVESLSEIQSAGLTPDAFYDQRHKRLAEILFAMHEAADPIDVITVRQKLTDLNELNSVGGLLYLCSLPNETPSAANLDYYLEILKEKYERRHLLEFCSVCSRNVFGATDTAQLLDQAERDILGIRSDKSANIRPIKTLVQSAISRLEDYHTRKGLIGLPTGFLDLDKKTGGLQNGDMIIIAGRPSLGKTSMAMNIGEKIALEQLPVGVFSLEMSADSLVMRMICSYGRVNIRNIQEGQFSTADFPKITNAAAKISKAPLHIDDSSGLSISALRARARRMHRQFGIKVLIIDYLQLLHSDNPKSKTRQEEVADISGGIKALGKELGIPIIAICQLSREVEQRAAKAASQNHKVDKSDYGKPMLADLRESGAIEQDADFVGLLYQDAERNQSYQPNCLPINLLIAKQRNGPTGDVRLIFRQDITRFENYSEKE